MGIWGIVGMGGHNVDARSGMARRDIYDGPSFNSIDNKKKTISYWKNEVSYWTGRIRNGKDQVEKWQKLVDEEDSRVNTSLLHVSEDCLQSYVRRVEFAKSKIKELRKCNKRER